MPAPVSVTGIGIVSALGSSRDTFRDALLAGSSGIKLLNAFETASTCRTRAAASVSDFVVSEWVAPMKSRRMDTTGPYAIAITRQALDDARFPISGDGSDDVGVILGTYSAGGQATREYLESLHRSGPTGAPALLFNSTVSNAAASLAGLEFKLRGPNITISQKEASGLAAIATAVDYLRQGRAGAIVAGGVDSMYEFFYRVHDWFEVMPAGGPGEVVSRPFDRRRQGFVMGEGGAALLLESEHLPTRGHIYGQILGVAAAGTSVPLNAWPDRSEALARTIRLALADAALSPADIDVVYASANSTVALDHAEALALDDVFADQGPLITSIKGAIGEFSAAGAASCAAALLCGEAGAVPPIVGLEQPDEIAERLRLALTAEALPGPVALVNSFASGGSLCSVVLRIGAC